MLAGCWAHVRSKFFEALDYAPREAGLVLHLLQNLYRTEARLRKTRAGPRLRAISRSYESQPVIERLLRTLQHCKAGRRFLPQSLMGKAIEYAFGQWLSAMASAPGQGGYDAATQRVDALITFSNNSVAIASIGMDASIRVVALTGEPDPAGRLPVKFGTSSSPGYGQLPVAVVSFQPGKAKLSEKNNQAVYDFEQERIIAQEGAEAPGVTGARFLSFENAVAGYGAEGERATAFVATLGGVQAKANVGL